MKKVVRYNRVGPSGNIYAVMGGAVRVLRESGKDGKAVEMVDRVKNSGSYDEALKIIGEYVELVEE